MIRSAFPYGKISIQKTLLVVLTIEVVKKIISNLTGMQALGEGKRKEEGGFTPFLIILISSQT